MPTGPDTCLNLPCWKKVVFGLLISLAFFTALEAVLACFGVSPVLVTRDPFVGFDSRVPLFVEATRNGHAVLSTAANKLDYFNAQDFSPRKLPGSYRIFCLGGSTTYGRPYDDTVSFPGWLRELLPEADATKNWEVINAGGISYASYRVAALMEELTNYQPDLFVIYSGHNEFLEERTYRHTRRLPWAVRRASAWLTRTRTYAALSTRLSPVRPPQWKPFTLPGEVDPVLDHTSGPSTYRRDERLRRQILNHYRANLARMVDIARRVGAAVLFVTPASNIKDCSPLKSQHDSRLTERQYNQWMDRFKNGKDLQQAGALTEALAAYQEALAIDNRFAELHYRLGQVYFGLERIDEAAAAFTRARDEDVCPLRAPSEVPRIVVQAAEQGGASVIDFASLLRESCLREHGHAAPGRAYFLDHVHLTIQSNQMLALAIVDRLIRQGVVQQDDSWNEDAVARVHLQIEKRIDRRAHAVALRNLARVLWWAGKHEEAGPLALQALEVIPDDADSLIVAGLYLRMNGRKKEAVDCFSQALRQQPFDVDAYHYVCTELVAQGQLEKAQAHMADALRIKPDDARLHHRMGEILEQLGKRAEAVVHYNEALRIRPDYKDAQRRVESAHREEHGGS